MQLASLPCFRSGTVKADVVSWVASEGRRRSPRGEREADISGTLDVTEMGNWTTGCARYKVWDALGEERAPVHSFTQHLYSFFSLYPCCQCGFGDSDDNQSVKHSGAAASILTMSTTPTSFRPFGARFSFRETKCSWRDELHLVVAEDLAIRGHSAWAQMQPSRRLSWRRAAIGTVSGACCC